METIINWSQKLAKKKKGQLSPLCPGLNLIHFLSRRVYTFEIIFDSPPPPNSEIFSRWKWQTTLPSSSPCRFFRKFHMPLTRLWREFCHFPPLNLRSSTQDTWFGSKWPMAGPGACMNGTLPSYLHHPNCCQGSWYHPRGGVGGRKGHQEWWPMSSHLDLEAFKKNSGFTNQGYTVFIRPEDRHRNWE